MKKNAFYSIENIKICDLTEIHIQKWTNENAKRYSAKSIRNQVGLLSAVLKQNKSSIDVKDIALKPMQKSEYLVPNVENKLVEKSENKSYSGTRKLDVPTYLQEVLNKAKSDTTSEHISELTPALVLKKFNKLCLDNDLPKFKMHSLRHANASMMLLQEVKWL